MTPYDFSAHNLTAYCGLLPVAIMLEKLGFQQLVKETPTVKRQTRSMPVFRFILGMILACYVGFSRLHHLGFLKREPMLTSILRVAELPEQCTFWRFLASLHLGIARQLLVVQKRMRERVVIVIDAIEPLAKSPAAASAWVAGLIALDLRGR